MAVALDRFDDLGPDEAEEMFTGVIEIGAKAAVPHGSGVRQPKPWWNSDLDSALRARRVARRAASGGTEEDVAHYKAKVAEVTSAIEAAKRVHDEKCLLKAVESNDLGRVHAQVRTMRGQKGREPIPALLGLDGAVIKGAQAKADAFAERYAAMGSQSKDEQVAEAECAMHLPKASEVGNEGAESPFRVEELEAVLSILKAGKASGEDGVSNECLVNLGKYGRIALLALCNRSWRELVVYQRWKHEVVVPLHKRDRPIDQVASYRPISLTSCVSKCMERLVAARLLTVWGSAPTSDARTLCNLFSPFPGACVRRSVGPGGLGPLAHGTTRVGMPGKPTAREAPVKRGGGQSEVGDNPTTTTTTTAGEDSVHGRATARSAGSGAGDAHRDAPPVDRVAELEGMADRCFIADEQAAYLSGRTLEQLVARLLAMTSAALDKGKAAAVLLVDFEDAFGQVPLHRTLLKLVRWEVPPRLVLWLQAFVTGRRFAVRVEDASSAHRLRHKGAPQGSVLGPLLYLVHVNSVVKSVKDSVPGGSVHLYADDLTVLVTADSETQLQGAAEQALIGLDGWCARNHARVSSKKGGAVYMRLARKGVPPDLSLACRGVPLKRVEEKVLLGVTLDSKGTLDAHTKGRLKSITDAVALVAQFESVLPTLTLKLLYEAYGLSRCLNNVGAWGPLLKKGQWEKLETAHRRAARVIAGLSRSAHNGISLREAGLQSLQHTAVTRTALMMDAVRRRVEGDMTKRTLQCDDGSAAAWQRCYAAVTSAAFPEMSYRCLPRVVRPPPWADTGPAPECIVELVDKVSKADTEEKQHAAAEATLRALRHDVLVFTDGSVKNPEQCGPGSSSFCIVDTSGVWHEWAGWTSLRSVSYEAELCAVMWAAEALCDPAVAMPPGARVVIAVDCRAVVVALARGVHRARRQAEVVTLLRLAKLSSDRGCSVTMQWIPGHCGLQMNDRVDRLAKDVLDEDAAIRPAALVAEAQLARALILADRRSSWALCTKDEELGVAGAGDGQKWWDCVGPAYVGDCPADDRLPRGVQRHLARLRSNRSPLVAKMAYKWKQCASPICVRCQECEEDVAHLLCCKATAGLRMECFQGTDHPGTQALRTEQTRVAVFLVRLGLIQPFKFVVSRLRKGLSPGGAVAE
eukprot:Hpha_TRINITY_DN16666_c2_g1::TRINITY_DN16666_c2_g1_i1::g.178532::m.178532